LEVKRRREKGGSKKDSISKDQAPKEEKSKKRKRGQFGKTDHSSKKGGKITMMSRRGGKQGRLLERDREGGVFRGEPIVETRPGVMDSKKSGSRGGEVRPTYWGVQGWSC